MRGAGRFWGLPLLGAMALSACGGASRGSSGPGSASGTSVAGESTAAASFGPQIAVGSDFGCWLGTNKKVGCWGSLKDAAPDGAFRQISAASFHACGVTEAGEAKCWGEYDAAPAGQFAQVSAGDQASCGVRVDGELVCWGAQGKTEYSAELIEKCGSTKEYPECKDFSWLGMRIVMKRPKGKFKQVAVGGRHVCALARSGEVKCWAPAEDDQDEAGAREVDDISLPPGKYRELAAGFLHTCGIEAGETAGKVVCAGGYEGQSEPTPEAAAAVHVAIGVVNSCALLADGHVSCWGSGERGATSVPSDGGFVAVAVGLHVVCALSAKGTPRCWGDDSSPAARP